MRIIPVLDVKAGHAVRAIAGDRAHYRPVRSVLHPSSDPLDLARAYRDRLGCAELYVADLDAIAGAEPAWDLYRGVCALGLRLWLDAGVRIAADMRRLIEAGTDVVVIGLETIAGPEEIGGIGHGSWCVIENSTHPTEPGSSPLSPRPSSLAFSLDLRDGRPLVDTHAAWGTEDPVAIAGRVLGRGVSRVILLDLARVGTGRGVGTHGLLEELRARHPGVELVAGGGIAGARDLEELAARGATAALVGSALHDGRLGPDDLPW